MTLPDQDGARKWIGRTVVDRNGADIGVCAAVLADTTTGLPEWLSVERDEVTLIVPLLEATESGGRVHVTVTRAYADGAPRFGPTDELTRDQEAALYRHYGIEYSAATSDSLLPAGAQPTEDRATAAGSAGSAPDAASGQPVAGGARGGRGVAAVVAVLLGLTAAVVAAVRLRRGTSPVQRLRRRGAPPPRRAAGPVLAFPTAARARAVQAAAVARPVVEASGRRVMSGASAGSAAARRAALATARQSRAATAAATTAAMTAAMTAARTYTDVAAARLAPLLATTGQAAWSAVRAGTDSALRVTDATTEAVVAAVPRMTAGTARAGRRGLRAVLTVGAAAEAVPEVVAETGERLEKGWKRIMGRLSLGLGFGVGYVLGARAGRPRYEQIKRAAADVMERPEVRDALEKARTAAPAPLQGSIEKLSRRSSSSQGAGAAPLDVDAVLVDEVDVVVTPAPPVAGTGGPDGTDAPRPDPLIPPAKSGDDPGARP